MECKSGVQGIKELSDEGTPVEVLEGDGDTTMLAHIKTDLNRTLKKRDDRNHIVKNIGKNLYAVKKLSKSVIQHLQKCLKYAFAKNAGDKIGMEENLRAIIPHQFGDHSSCHPRFCGVDLNADQRKSTFTEAYHTKLLSRMTISDLNLKKSWNQSSTMLNKWQI